MLNMGSKDVVSYCDILHYSDCQTVCGWQWLQTATAAVAGQCQQPQAALAVVAVATNSCSSRCGGSVAAATNSQKQLLKWRQRPQTPTDAVAGQRQQQQPWQVFTSSYWSRGSGYKRGPMPWRVSGSISKWQQPPWLVSASRLQTAAVAVAGHWQF